MFRNPTPYDQEPKSFGKHKLKRISVFGKAGMFIDVSETNRLRSCWFIFLLELMFINLVIVHYWLDDRCRFPGRFDQPVGEQLYFQVIFFYKAHTCIHSPGR
jgi:hypothetical protein